MGPGLFNFNSFRNHSKKQTNRAILTPNPQLWLSNAKAYLISYAYITLFTTGVATLCVLRTGDFCLNLNFSKLLEGRGLAPLALPAPRSLNFSYVLMVISILFTCNNRPMSRLSTLSSLISFVRGIVGHLKSRNSLLFNTGSTAQV